MPTWRNPRFAHDHLGLTAGVSAISIVGTSTVAAGFPLDRLIDDRHGIQFKFGESVNTHWIQFDLGAALPTFKRVFIPNHNLNGGWVQIDEDDNSGHSTPNNLYAATQVTSADDLSIELGTASAQQFIRISFPTVAGQWALGQIRLTNTVTTERGPKPDWIDEPRPNVSSFHSGATTQDDPDQRFIEYVYRWVNGADLVVLDALVAAMSTHRPFLLDTPWETPDGTENLFVKLVRIRSTGDTDNPQADGEFKKFTLAMEQSLL